MSNEIFNNEFFFSSIAGDPIGFQRQRWLSICYSFDKVRGSANHVNVNVNL